MIRVVLASPQIPQNTGNVARTCVCTGTPLVLCGPMGFTITEAKVRRAGLDYWPALDLTMLDTLQELYDAFPAGEFWYYSSKAQKLFSDVRYGSDAILVFGSETTGLPEDVRMQNAERLVRIPMRSDQRCLNLSNAVCTGLYEALRQNGYAGLT